MSHKQEQQRTMEEFSKYDSACVLKAT